MVVFQVNIYILHSQKVAVSGKPLQKAYTLGQNKTENLQCNHPNKLRERGGMDYRKSKGIVEATVYDVCLNILYPILKECKR